MSIPVFFLLIGIELVVERLSHRKLYRFPDAIANLSCGITSQLSGLFMRVLAVGIYEILFHQLALFSPDRTTWWYWLSLFLLVDFAYYWAHRMSHEVNLFWGGHVVHHQSEDYNLSVALRQSSFQVVWTFAFSLPLALLGFETADFVLISAFNTLYQFWIHTETIGKLGWLEYVFNTPSHHRVHHGRNPKYIDKNHAGTLIIWDRLFGTFQEEEERPTYGITKPLNSWNAVWANVSHYQNMWTDLKQIPSLKDKAKYLFAKPGWLPGYLGGYRAAPEIEPNYKKYDTPAPVKISYYVLFQYVTCIGVTALLLFKQNEYSLVEKAVAAALIGWWVTHCGVLFEQKAWVLWAEWLRLVAMTLSAVGWVYLTEMPATWYAAPILYVLVSSVWFKRIT